MVRLRTPTWNSVKVGVCENDKTSKLQQQVGGCFEKISQFFKVCCYSQELGF